MSRFAFQVQGSNHSRPTNTASRYETGFYSTDHYTDTLIRFLEERDSTNKTKPFFAALPFAAPHWPLQCSREDRQKYKASGNFLWPVLSNHHRGNTTMVLPHCANGESLV